MANRMNNSHYHKVTHADCLTIATVTERSKLNFITPMDLLTELAARWCAQHGYTLGGYLGNWSWDATRAGEYNG